MIRQVRFSSGKPAAPALLLLIWAALTACESSATRSSGPEVTDSAGVQIVRNTGHRWPEGRGWRFSDEPLLHIGVLEGDPSYQLFRVAGAVRLSDGRIVIANSGTNELRYYDSTGTYLSSSGRKGGGPGEFDGLMSLWVSAGDSLHTYDWRNRRISVFDSSGNFVRSITLHLLTQAGGFVNHVSQFSDGSLLIGVQQMFASGDIKSGLRRDTVLYLHLDPGGIVIDTAGRFPGGEMYVKSSADGIEASTRAFGRFPYVAVHQDGFYYGSSDAYVIGFYSADGRLRRLVEVARPNLPVTSGDIERYKQELFDDADDEAERQRYERLYADMPFPETMPAYETFRVDAGGNLWVGDYRKPGDDQPRWTVFDPDGVMLGVVETPQGFRVYEIGNDYVLGRWTDELDVEHVQLYELVKP